MENGKRRHVVCSRRKNGMNATNNVNKTRSKRRESERVKWTPKEMSKNLKSDKRTDKALNCFRLFNVSVGHGGTAYYSWLACVSRFFLFWPTNRAVKTQKIRLSHLVMRWAERKFTLSSLSSTASTVCDLSLAFLSDISLSFSVFADGTRTWFSNVYLSHECLQSLHYPTGRPMVDSCDDGLLR